MIIFIEELAYKTHPQDLQKLFEKYGAVKSVNIRFIINGPIYGTVEMPNRREAKKAIQELDGYELDGIHITLS